MQIRHVFRSGKPLTHHQCSWMKLQEIGAKYLLKTGGLDYQRLVRVENPGWDESHANSPCFPQRKTINSSSVFIYS
jgi:hypothetical protein